MRIIRGFIAWHRRGQPDGRDYRWGYNDPMMFRAATTRTEVTALPGMGGSHRTSWAIPLELIVATPIHGWNPYAVPALSAAPTGTGASAATAFSGANRDGKWYITPASLFTAADGSIDPADTGGVKWVTGGDGTAREMIASGLRVHIPPMQGVPASRTRWPIAPAHHEGNFVHGQVEAVRRETQRAIAVLAKEVIAMKLEDRS